MFDCPILRSCQRTVTLGNCRLAIGMAHPLNIKHLFNIFGDNNELGATTGTYI
jgi:hypothetical protein